ncbi:MAG: ThiF family adenylyltransferase, partial [Steroidobacteraceae bacterium]
TYLAGAGVGLIGIVDDDRLEPSNLHRQPLYALADAGKPKVELAAERLRALNPEIELRTHAVRLSPKNGADLLQPYELVIDCTDNFSTKFLINDLCMRLGKSAILSSVYQFEGQLQVVRPNRGGTCLRCLWPEATRDGLVGNCSEAGVLGPVPGAFGCLEALEALKILLDLPGQLGDELLLVDLLTNSVSRIRTHRATECSGGPCARLPDLSAAAIGDAAASEAPSLELTFEDLAEADRQGFTIIDVREPREVAAAPAPAERVRHIPLHALIERVRSGPAEAKRTPEGAERRTDEAERPLSPSGKYLLVCASGKRSLAGAQELRARGFSAAYSLSGGVAALEQPLSA